VQNNEARIELILIQPEAAAVHTLAAIQPNKLNIGDNMVVCDAGGGTVDLISYKITNLEPLQVIESTQGEGGLCGGVFVNRRFEAHIKDRLGEERFNKFKTANPKSWRVALEFFEERVKRWFGARSMTTFDVPFPGFPDDEAAGIEASFLTLKSEQVKQIFDPVVEKVIILVDNQVRALRAEGEKVAAIICVGGFGQSAYLRKRLAAHFQTDLPPAYSSQDGSSSSNDSVPDVDNDSIEVMVLTDCWTACVRGALQRGLQDSIVMSRKCRFHYGIKVSPKFQAGVHPVNSRKWCDVQEYFKASGVMRWYLSKGETIDKDHQVAFHFSRSWSKHPLTGTQEHYAHTTLLASASASQALMKDDASVFNVCTLTTDLRTIPRRHFRKCTAPSGKRYYSISYDLVMKINSADIDFSLEIDDKSYSSVAASFEHSSLAPSFES